MCFVIFVFCRLRQIGKAASSSCVCPRSSEPALMFIQKRKLVHRGRETQTSEEAQTPCPSELLNIDFSLSWKGTEPGPDVCGAGMLLKVRQLGPRPSHFGCGVTAVCTHVRSRPGQPDFILLYPSLSSARFTGDVHDPRFEILLSNWRLENDSACRLPVSRRAPHADSQLVCRDHG